jgi:Rieske Fe-S protein
MLPVAGDPGAARGGDALTRRDFLATTTYSILAAALASACGGGDVTGPGGGQPAPAGVTLQGNVLRVPLSAVPELAGSGGYRVISTVQGAPANVIIINVAGSYRAFTAVCTHEGCLVDSFNGSRIRCACHGSEFDTSGRNVLGPAPRPLAEYGTSFDAAQQVITVQKSS